MSNELAKGKDKIIKRLSAENKQLNRIVGLTLSAAHCENLHHPKKYRHELGDPCLVEEEINGLLQGESKK